MKKEREVKHHSQPANLLEDLLRRRDEDRERIKKSIKNPSR
jgi:hypothetical protein